MKNNKLGIAIIGSGYWGKNLIRNYHSLGALRLICDKDETLLSKFREEYADVEVCIALNDILKRDDIDGVVVATPAETHFAIAREVLLARKHVYVEKPLVLDENEAKTLITLAEERNCVLMVGHLLQYHPVFIRLKTLAATGELGRINYIYSNRLNLGKIRREENILWSFAPHDISMILALAGENPSGVYATGGNYLHKQIADVTTTHLEFPSGLRAHIFVSWLHPFKEQKLVVVGDKKMAVFDDTQPWDRKLILYPHSIRWENNIPIPDKAEAEPVEIPQAEPLRMECQHFLNCMLTDETPLTDGNEGLRVLQVLRAAQKCLTHQLPPLQADVAPPHNSQVQTHESAVIDDDVKMGEGTKVWHFSHIISGTRIGKDCNIGQNVVIGPDVSVGNNVKIQNNVSVYKGVTLEDGVFCGPSMVFTNVYNPRSYISRKNEFRPTLVREGATLGANATIVCGNSIGRFAFVAAGAVVTQDVPDYALMVGNPAKLKGWICQCGIRLEENGDQLECTECGKAYYNANDRITAKTK